MELEAHEGFLEARFLGAFSVKGFNAQVDKSMAACRERKLKLLLIDTTRLEALLTMNDRFEIGCHGAQSGAGIKVSVWAAPEQIDPRRFAMMVAKNRGLNVAVFPDRRDALDWLLGIAPSSAP
ncbi:MAG: hypothetical protein HY293_02945 [Planctomycetes bacterium]|nr:hypothetical protein [Planctomycetota bacterium]